MTDSNREMLDMVRRGASVNEIVALTGISNKQLFYRLNMLKLRGFDFSKKYYYDGEIVYHLNRGLTKVNDDINLLTSSKDKDFKAVFLSDLHIGNNCERLDLLDKVYEFCIKEGIHIIINGGDLIDGTFGNNKKIVDVDEQIDYVLEKYPFDKNILNFICLGNHDFSILQKNGQNLETILLARRHDIVSLGYGIGILNIKNDRLIVTHPSTPKSQGLGPISDGLVLTGHSHKSKIAHGGHLFNMYLPTLSDLQIDGSCSLPGFVKADISFKESGYFNIGVFEQYVFMDKMYKVNECSLELGLGKSNQIGIIKNIEERLPVNLNDDALKVKVLKK